ncbi:hypothetical protein GRI89_10385 [Altererythrobacter salegens]|uniref:Uncharacterized protein n=1 Tax=Croceibacterium salegens TaxID=1737568 RepID=A0A6I4SYU0_9SPHN|nr:hypothetical protein [Croceibacterium salegens]MXO59946.1 hypothetical protein [Croceibacterium salegens]
MTENFLCSRRFLMAGMAGTASLLGLPIGALAVDRVPALSARGPHFAYFNDALLTDPTGHLPAYRRPAGYRGARRESQMVPDGWG